MIKKINTLRFHLILIVVGVVLDQLTKLWAVARFTNESGFPNYQKVQIFGDYFRFALAYNEGAAFSSRPQDILPFLPPERAVPFKVMFPASSAATWSVPPF